MQTLGIYQNSYKGGRELGVGEGERKIGNVCTRNSFYSSVEWNISSVNDKSTFTLDIHYSPCVHILMYFQSNLGNFR